MPDTLSINSRIATLRHGSLSWLEAGRGDAIVFLHGIGSAARSFDAQLASLSARWRTLAWNAPGYGGSAPFAEDAPDVGRYADAVAEWLDALDIETCHLVGHSLGSLIAARLAAARPARVRTLTLASCAIGHATLPDDKRRELLASRLDDVRRLGPRGMAEKRGPRLLGPDAPDAAVRSVVDIMASIEPRGYAQAARMLSKGDMLADLARLSPMVPVQVAYGTADVITPPEVNLRAAHARAGASLATIDRAGHALYVESPVQFNAIVQAFIAGR